MLLMSICWCWCWCCHWAHVKLWLVNLMIANRTCLKGRSTMWRTFRCPSWASRCTRCSSSSSTFGPSIDSSWTRCDTTPSSMSCSSSLLTFEEATLYSLSTLPKLHLTVDQPTQLITSDLYIIQSSSPFDSIVCRVSNKFWEDRERVRLDGFWTLS